MTITLGRATNRNKCLGRPNSERDSLAFHIPKPLLSSRPLPITVQQPRLPPECIDYEFFSLIYRYTYYEI